MILTLILAGGLEHFVFFHILRITIPTDFHIFQKGRSTTKQYYHLLIPMVAISLGHSLFGEPRGLGSFMC